MASTKTCCMCGTDVSQTKRTKDAQGRYYCEPCTHSEHQRIEPTTPASALDELAYLGQSSDRRANRQPVSAASDPALAALIGQLDVDAGRGPIVAKHTVRPRQQTRSKSMLPMVVIGLFGVIIIGGGIVGILAATGNIRSANSTDDHAVAQKPTESEKIAARVEQARREEQQRAQDEERQRQEDARHIEERQRGDEERRQNEEKQRQIAASDPASLAASFRVFAAKFTNVLAGGPATVKHRPGVMGFDIRYDVVKTDSLLQPINAFIQWNEATESDLRGPIKSHDAFTATFTFANGQWSLAGCNMISYMNDKNIYEGSAYWEEVKKRAEEANR